MSHRCFLALRAPVIEDYIEILKDLKQYGKVNIVDPLLYHFTLHFFGNISKNEISALEEKLKISGVPFEITLADTGAIPNLRKPRVLYISISDGRKELESIHQQINVQLEDLLGYQIKKKLLPHLTVARVKRSDTPEAIGKIWNEAIPKHQTFTVKEVVLIESILTPNGPVYMNLFTFSLK